MVFIKVVATLRLRDAIDVLLEGNNGDTTNGAFHLFRAIGFSDFFHATNIERGACATAIAVGTLIAVAASAVGEGGGMRALDNGFGALAGDQAEREAI